MKKKRAVPTSKKTETAKPQAVLKNKISINNVSIAATSPTEKRHAAKSKPSTAVAVIALLINILLIPGLGTIIGGKMKQGLVQLLLLWLGGIIVTFLGFFLVMASQMAGLVVAMLGSLMVLAGWVWAIVSGVLIVRDASS